MSSERPGLRRCPSPQLDAIEVMERQLAELRRAAEQPAPGVELSSRDVDRLNIHAAFMCAVEALQLSGWSRNKIAGVLDVDPVTLKGWIEAGFRQRDQLPMWLVGAIGRLPEVAWTAFWRDVQRTRRIAPRNGTTG